MEEEQIVSSEAGSVPGEDLSLPIESGDSAFAVNNPPAMHWYRTWWGITIMVVGVVVLVFGSFFLYNVVKFYQMIKEGNGPELEKKYAESDYRVNPQLAAMRLELESGDHPYLGNNEAPVTIVAFYDYKCPYTIDAAPSMFQLAQKFGNKVKLIIRDFPSESLHPGANEVAKLADCAYKMGFYWPAYTWIFSNQDSLPTSTIMSDEYANQFAGTFGADTKQFLACFHSSDVDMTINKNFADGYRFGVRGTPTFFINGEKVQGAVDYNIWEGYLKQFAD